MKKLERHPVEPEGFYVFQGYLLIYFTFSKQGSLPEPLPTWLVLIQLINLWKSVLSILMAYR